MQAVDEPLSLASVLARSEYVLLDGSMGTELFARGLESGLAPEIWNLEEPAAVQAVHDAYVAAGAQLILTNSFGGTRYRLALHGLDDRVVEVNRVAAELARRAADGAPGPDGRRRVLVAGSMGPTGELLEPLGAMTVDGCRSAFAQQAEGLVAGGVDLLWIETMSSLEEVEAAVAGIRQVTDRPICATLSFDTAGRTMMGVTGAEVATRLGPLGLAAIGANCGNNLADSERALAQLLEADPTVVAIAKCNAGVPEWRDGQLRYGAGSDEMAAHAHRLRQLGVRLIGGCCGSTPAHIEAMGAVLAGLAPVPDVAVEPSMGEGSGAEASLAGAEGEGEDAPAGRPARRRRRRSASRSGPGA